MDYRTILLISALFIFSFYILFVYVKYGILTSISESYYRLPTKMQPMFTLVLWVVSLAIIISASTALMFVAGAGICYTAAAPLFRGKPEKETKTTETNVHYVGAVIGLVVSQISLCVDFQLYPFAIFNLAVFVLATFTSKNYLWWIECFTFATVIVGLYTVLN